LATRNYQGFFVRLRLSRLYILWLLLRLFVAEPGASYHKNNDCLPFEILAGEAL
jgi:hypothetical protein